MRRWLFASALVIVTAAGCGGAPPVVTPADAARANLALADLEHGRDLLVGRCSGCHAAPLPNARPIADWPRELDDMGARAHLDRKQRQLIEQYLITMAAP
jgi:hypothetical protein